MRRFIVVTAVTCTAAAGAPAMAQANAESMKPKCSKKLLRSANHHRKIVVKKHGVDAAGRDIVKYGRIRANQKTTPSKCGEIKKYRKQLIVLHTEPKYYPLIVRTAAKPYQAPAGTQSPSVATPANGTLAAIRSCESGGNYSTNTGNGFYGAYQFTQSTWQSVGGSGNPAAASPAEQDKRAAMLYAQQGSSPWPVCGQ